jgi:hypothetical protein
MDPRQLLTFRRVVHERSFSRTAEKLSLSQPSVSHQLALLEIEIGIRLLDRGRTAADARRRGTARYGEMSTFMNYTYQSFNFRNRQGARPFYGLVASIAAEEFGHIELVSTAINTMLSGATEGEPGDLGDLSDVKDVRNTQHFIAGGAGTLVQDSMGKPWNGDCVFASGDLIEDLTHNFFLETGARNNKLKVYCTRWPTLASWRT